MDTTEYIQYIQAEIKNKNYDDYVYAFLEYKEYLENRIKENSNDVEAICQLAAVYFELRYETHISTNIMEKLLVSAKSDMSDEDKARVYINLAFLYEDNGDKENIYRCLKSAVALATSFPNAYDALGRFYIENEYDENALPLFQKACSLSDAVKYQYNYGIALFCADRIAEAKAIFEELLPQSREDRRALYAYGVCCFYTGDSTKATQIANELALNLIDDYISGSEIADLYFLCSEYIKHNEIYDKECYALDVSWLSPYFYSLKALGKQVELEKKFVEFTSEKNKEISEARAEELDEDYTELDKIEHIGRLQKDLEMMVTAYENIKDSDDKPQIKIKLWFMYGCYLIDCPRHQPTK